MAHAHPSSMKLVCLIICMAVCAEYASARLLRGQSSSSKAKQVTRGDNKKGAKFDFTGDEGAQNFLNNMGQDKLNRVLANSKFRQHRNKLAQMLDEDQDMVRCDFFTCSS